jgi:hypothetical protein
MLRPLFLLQVMGDIHVVNVRKMIFAMIHVFFDMIPGAYLIGTLIIKGSRTERFRTKQKNLSVPILRGCRDLHRLDSRQFNIGKEYYLLFLVRSKSISCKFLCLACFMDWSELKERGWEHMVVECSLRAEKISTLDNLHG